MIHAVLQSRLKGTASPRNHNNRWGVPLSMLAIEPQHDYAVLELAARKPGEIAALAELTSPKVGVIAQRFKSGRRGNHLRVVGRRSPRRDRDQDRTAGRVARQRASRADGRLVAAALGLRSRRRSRGSARGRSATFVRST